MKCVVSIFVALQSIAFGSYVWEPLEKGTYPIGFRFIVETDSSRPALPPATGSGRQIPIAIWYPAKCASDRALQLRDYVIAAERALIGTVSKNDDEVIGEFAASHSSPHIARSDYERLLNMPVAAISDLPPAKERFSLVLFAHASPETESATCEYLASHGYVVAAVRSRAANDVAYKLSRENLDAMVADHAFAAARMLREPNIASGPIAVIGMSNGSIAALALQLKAAKIGAIVSLDGGIGEDAGGTYLKERSNGDIAKLAAPIIHFYAPNNPHLNLEHLRSYYASSRTLIFVRGMRHQDFLAYPMFDRIVAGFSGEGASTDALPGFVWVNRYTLNFLDAHLLHKGDAEKWLATSPELHGAPAGLLVIEQLNQS